MVAPRDRAAYNAPSHSSKTEMRAPTTVQLAVLNAPARWWGSAAFPSAEMSERSGMARVRSSTVPPGPCGSAAAGGLCDSGQEEPGSRRGGTSPWGGRGPYVAGSGRWSGKGLSIEEWRPVEQLRGWEGQALSSGPAVCQVGGGQEPGRKAVAATAGQLGGARPRPQRRGGASGGSTGGERQRDGGRPGVASQEEGDGRRGRGGVGRDEAEGPPAQLQEDGLR